MIIKLKHVNLDLEYLKNLQINEKVYEYRLTAKYCKNINTRLNEKNTKLHQTC
jgi:hypothetical protein